MKLTVLVMCIVFTLKQNFEVQFTITTLALGSEPLCQIRSPSIKFIDYREFIIISRKLPKKFSSPDYIFEIFVRNQNFELDLVSILEAT